MHRNPLPEIVPIFPLTGVLLLPGMFLPLHIFEPRYRNMVADARAADGYIAMVQPVVPRQDNAPPPDAPPENPEVYPVGCLGHMERCEQTPDGRYAITLRGISRFRLHEELPLENGYRRVVAAYEEFRADPDEPELAFDGSRLLQALKAFSEANRVPFDLQRVESVPGIALLNGLAMSLPFGPAEKQALLEAPAPGDRERVLLELMGMGLKQAAERDDHIPPPLN